MKAALYFGIALISVGFASGNQAMSQLKSKLNVQLKNKAAQNGQDGQTLHDIFSHNRAQNKRQAPSANKMNLGQSQKKRGFAQKTFAQTKQAAQYENPGRYADQYCAEKIGSNYYTDYDYYSWPVWSDCYNGILNSLISFENYGVWRSSIDAKGYGNFYYEFHPEQRDSYGGYSSQYGGYDNSMYNYGGYDNSMYNYGGYDNSMYGYGGYDTSMYGYGGYDNSMYGYGGYDTSMYGYDTSYPSYDQSYYNYSSYESYDSYGNYSNYTSCPQYYTLIDYWNNYGSICDIDRQYVDASYQLFQNNGWDFYASNATDVFIDYVMSNPSFICQVEPSQCYGSTYYAQKKSLFAQIKKRHD